MPAATPQERQLLAEGVNGWQQNYFMPGTSDTGVAAWRAWLQRYGSAMPLLPRKLEDLPPLMSRRQALDRFEQHTKHCPDCQKVCRGRLGASGTRACSLPCMVPRTCLVAQYLSLLFLQLWPLLLETLCPSHHFDQAAQH